jgi:hypothetical protein
MTVRCGPVRWWNLLTQSNPAPRFSFLHKFETLARSLLIALLNMANQRVDPETIEETPLAYPAVADLFSFLPLLVVPAFITLVVIAAGCLYLLTE